jgi:hypothetical protein
VIVKLVLTLNIYSRISVKSGGGTPLNKDKVPREVFL